MKKHTNGRQLCQALRGISCKVIWSVNYYVMEIEHQQDRCIFVLKNIVILLYGVIGCSAVTLDYAGVPEQIFWFLRFLEKNQFFITAWW